MTKLKIWKEGSSFKESEKLWNEREKIAAEKHPIKQLKKLPKMIGITKETAKNLKWKAFLWMIKKDKDRKVLRGFMRHPLRYGIGYLCSLFVNNKIKKDGDFFLYGVNNVEEFQDLLQCEDTLLVVGFSYCHKPHECPSKRFTSDCIHDPENPVCQQCFIGKMIHSLPEEKVVPLIIPTVHYIAEKIFEVVHANPDKRVIFLITACEMTLEMFSDWGLMTKIKGVGVRLDGRICNTMDAFRLSEEGIKPGLTVVLDDTKKRMLDLIRIRRETCQ